MRTPDARRWVIGAMLGGLAWFAFRRSTRHARRARQADPELLALVAHEIRSPLSVIRAAAETLLAHGDALAGLRRAELLEAIASAAQRANRIADDMLTGAQAGEGGLDLRTEALDLPALASQAVREFGLLERGVDVVVIAQPGVPPARGDAVRTLQILTNLLRNAIEHARAHSVVIVSIVQDGERVRIAIHNDGRGIAPEEGSLLFQRYGRTRATSTRSTGLGLYIAKRLVDAMGGAIAFASETGRYATFWFTLPPARGPAPD